MKTGHLISRRPGYALAKDAILATRRRMAEVADVLRFLYQGEEDVGEPTRTYDPLPYPEAAPLHPHHYEDTGVGALYDLPDSERHLWQTAGWNLTPRKERSSR